MTKSLFAITVALGLLIAANDGFAGSINKHYKAILDNADDIYSLAKGLKNSSTVRRSAKKIKDKAGDLYVWTTGRCVRIDEARKSKNKVIKYANKIILYVGNRTAREGLIKKKAKKIKSDANRIYQHAKYKKTCKKK